LFFYHTALFAVVFSPHGKIFRINFGIIPNPGTIVQRNIRPETGRASAKSSANSLGLQVRKFAVVSVSQCLYNRIFNGTETILKDI